METVCTPAHRRRDAQGVSRGQRPGRGSTPAADSGLSGGNPGALSAGPVVPSPRHRCHTRGTTPREEEYPMELRTIPLHLIDRDPTYQVRQRWDPATDPTLETLAGSLAGPEGLLHPIVVVQRATPTTFGRLYTLIAGWRRLAAARSEEHTSEL